MVSTFSCQKNNETIDVKSSEITEDNNINLLRDHLSVLIDINKDSITYDKNSDSFVVKSLSMIQARESVQNIYDFQSTDTLKNMTIHEKF